ncbi:uncharacterized protein B0H18DRAFT_1029132 [Fomitopsis serialis]|uniref:uncharacterized protein n=1 Tax=Fomitopsis serialis TaxID=139415 RepID=UPI00200764E3|nr:uncharacterized protein B0H18DRAFT_1029132 [Neoantrodia serialis]KAH9919095.1 hypothetical protein B0H18DRAFT_1029132 [Neoantrodia serialis]
MAGLNLVLCMIFPHRMYYVTPSLVISQVYANSLLTSLLNRTFVTRDIRCADAQVNTLSFEVGQGHGTFNSTHTSIPDTVVETRFPTENMVRTPRQLTALILKATAHNRVLR